MRPHFLLWLLWLLNAASAFAPPTSRHPPRHMPSSIIVRPASADLSAISRSLPFITNASLLSDDVQFRAPLSRCRGRDEYVRLMRAWRSDVPARLSGFSAAPATVLPLSNDTLRCRYTARFVAPVPPQILPAQRARMARAGLLGRRTANVSVTTSVLLRLDARGRIASHTEERVDDPFDALATIAAFEWLLARKQVDAPHPPPRAP